MFAIKSELEDLCFAVLQPATYGALKAEVDEIWGVKTIPESAMNPVTNDHAQFLPLEYSGDNPDHSIPGWLGTSNANIPDVMQENATEHDAQAEFLTEDQIEVRDLIDTVLPFDATTFNMEKLRITPTARRGLEVLQRCAKALLQEITTEGVAIGLDISVHGRVKSLYSSFKKMARKGVKKAGKMEKEMVPVLPGTKTARNQGQGRLKTVGELGPPLAGTKTAASPLRQLRTNTAKGLELKRCGTRTGRSLPKQLLSRTNKRV